MHCLNKRGTFRPALTDASRAVGLKVNTEKSKRDIQKVTSGELSLRKQIIVYNKFVHTYAISQPSHCQN
jgi:hypothetical protein